MSYEDFLIESQMRGVEGISNINYDSLYQHDISEMQNTLEYKYGANVFTSQNDENLTEILVGSLSDQECNVYVNTENDNLNIQGLTKIASNVKLKPGYNTITLSNPLHIEKDNKFAIVIEITSEEDVGIGIEDNNDVWFGNAISNERESFVSENGIDWQDIYDENNMMNLSIKAYTQTDEKNFNVSDISGKGYANIGGKFSFSIETSYIYSNNKIGINIINSLGENITERFEINGDEIRGKGAFIKIECPNDIEQGQYEVLITEPNSNETISKTIQIDANNGEYITAKFEDEIFWSYVKSEFVDAITDSKTLTISAKKTEFDKVRNITETSGKEITDITGIEYLTNLESINLNANEITNLTPLSNLQHLKELYIEGNDCTDFSPLSNLSSLKKLHLGGNNMSNGLSFLQNLNNLEELRLHACEIPNEIDISYIFNLHKLKFLDLTLWRWVTEEHLQGVSDLSNLKTLELSSCNIGNIDFIEGLHLESLSIGNTTMPEGSNHVSDLSPIRNMTTLSSLSISKLPEIETLNDLVNLSNLDSLWCQGGKLRDATALDRDNFKDKTSWSNLSLTFNSINDEIIRTGEDMVIEVPKIIQQACNENSLLYSSSGVSLYNCEWEEFGKSVKINSNTNYFSIGIDSGYASWTWYNANIIEQQRLLDCIEISNVPSKTSYVEGQNFDDSGMKVIAKYNDGSSKEITDYIITDGNNLTVGKTTVTISYTENNVTKTKEQEITVVAKELTEIIITKEPTNKNYIEGQNFDSSGMKITAKYNDGSNKEVSNYTVTDGDNLTTDKTTVTISYTEKAITKTVNQTISVTPKVLINIEVTTAPNKTTYIEGQSFDSTGMKITATYNNDATNEITNYIVTDRDNLTTDKTAVTISYTENSVTKTTTQSITVNSKSLISISVTTPPTKTTYIESQDFDPTGMKVTATYNNSSSKEITNYTIIDGNNLTIDKTNVTISYTENDVTKTTMQTINVVKKELKSIEITTPPTKTTYIEGQDFDDAGMKVTATYSDNSSKDITNYSIAGGNNLSIDKTSITISYTENGTTKTVSQTITVSQKVLSKITITTPPSKTAYIEEQNFDTTGMKVTAHYNNDTTKEISNYTISDGNNLTVDKTTVTVSYTENNVTKTVSQSITVTKKTLESIKITTAPNKTTYIEGQNFDATGMKVTATYNNSTNREVTDYMVEDGNNLTSDKATVTISYTENGITKKTTQAITVTKKLEISFIGYSEVNQDGIKFIDNIEPSTTMKEMISNVKTNGTITVYKDDREVTDNNIKISTGMKVKISLNNENYEFKVVVKGDTNGDGESNLKDLLQINKHRLNKAKLTTEYLLAGDVNKDNEVNLRDLLQVNKYRLGKIKTF